MVLVLVAIQSIFPFLTNRLFFDFAAQHPETFGRSARNLSGCQIATLLRAVKSNEKHQPLNRLVFCHLFSVGWILLVVTFGLQMIGQCSSCWPIFERSAQLNGLLGRLSLLTLLFASIFSVFGLGMYDRKFFSLLRLFILITQLSIALLFQFIAFLWKTDDKKNFISGINAR
ncbi:hypothetical protein M3Y94_01294300 [Aphelenchoides besseyi]|nr:hypothetical protein M3Y94_01294300 [Aphelenchoides besseyi]